MTLQRLQSLQMLLQREQHGCDLAQSALQRASGLARHAAEQRDQLIAYRGDYQTRWAGQFSRGATMHILQCYRSFMQRLDQAVAMQTRQAEQAEVRLAQARQQLLEAERRVASVRKLIERRLAEMAHVGRQREQKLSDEQAQRMGRNVAPIDRLMPQ